MQLGLVTTCSRRQAESTSRQGKKRKRKRHGLFAEVGAPGARLVAGTPAPPAAAVEGERGRGRRRARCAAPASDDCATPAPPWGATPGALLPLFTRPRVAGRGSTMPGKHEPAAFPEVPRTGLTRRPRAENKRRQSLERGERIPTGRGSGRRAPHTPPNNRAASPVRRPRRGDKSVSPASYGIRYTCAGIEQPTNGHGATNSEASDDEPGTEWDTVTVTPSVACGQVLVYSFTLCRAKDRWTFHRPEPTRSLEGGNVKGSDLMPTILKRNHRPSLLHILGYRM